MKVEVLMSVMNQSNFDIAYKSKIDSDLLIINQCDRNDYGEIIVGEHRWRMISTTNRGLSNSRNMALKYAVGDICILSDDDEVFEKGYSDIVLEAYNKKNTASVIAFNVHRINYRMKKKYYKITKFKEASQYRSYASPMLTFRLSAIRSYSVMFDEKFGSGSLWGGGEENLFLNDIRSFKLKIYECPDYLATQDYSGTSVWFQGYNEKYFYNLGAFLEYSNKRNKYFRVILYSLYICFWKLRKERLLSPFSKLRWLYLGFNGIKKDVTYNKFMEGRK